MDLKAVLTRKLGPLPAWGWAVAVAGAVIAARVISGKGAFPKGSAAQPAATVVGASGLPASTAGESIIGQLSSSDISTLKGLLGPGPAGPIGKTGPPGTAPPPGTSKPSNYAGMRDPFGTVYPSYVHTAAQANAWIQRAIANGAHLPKGMTVQNALVH
jgi:hypothetical protein